MAILDGIRKAFKALPELASSGGALVLTIVILTLVAGVFIYEATTGGNINVDNTSSSLIANQSAEWSSLTSNFWAAALAVAGFIVIAVIAVVAFAVLGKKNLGGKM